MRKHEIMGPVLHPLIAVFFSLLLLASSSSWSLNFYRTPQSLFSSGETNLERLEKSATSTEFIFDFLIESEHRRQWISASTIARDLDLSDRVMYQKTEYVLREMRGYWALVERISDGKRDWAPVLELTSSPKDQGKAFTLISTTLRSAPSWRSDLILQLPPKTSLNILAIQDSWLKVKFESVIGYVDPNNVLMKADFATEVMDLQGNWHPTKYRDGFQMALKTGKNLAISQISEWKTNSKLGIMTETLEDKQLLLRQNLRLQKIQAQIWTKSKLPGHGIVYWRKADTVAKGPDGYTLTSEALLKREIFSIAFDNKNPKIGIVSSHGIFKSFDGGLTWAQLPQFKNENHPVSISPEGGWFVGFMKSRDQGKTFSQYLRTDSLTKLIQSQSHGAPRVLRLSEIGFSNSKMQIKVDTGTKMIKLATKSKEDVINDWDFLN